MESISKYLWSQVTGTGTLDICTHTWSHHSLLSPSSLNNTGLLHQDMCLTWLINVSSVSGLSTWWTSAPQPLVLILIWREELCYLINRRYLKCFSVILDNLKNYWQKLCHQMHLEFSLKVKNLPRNNSMRIKLNMRLAR